MILPPEIFTFSGGCNAIPRKSRFDRAVNRSSISDKCFVTLKKGIPFVLTLSVISGYAILDNITGKLFPGNNNSSKFPVCPNFEIPKLSIASFFCTISIKLQLAFINGMSLTNALNRVGLLTKS